MRKIWLEQFARFTGTHKAFRRGYSNRGPDRDYGYFIPATELRAKLRRVIDLARKGETMKMSHASIVKDFFSDK